MKDDAHTSRLARTLWRIETNLAEAPTLNALAEAEGISTFHLTRAFSLATGQPLMRYVRARRLSEAAKRLAIGDESVLNIALDTGYDSHEGFARAFRETFQCAPRDVRAGHRPILQEPLNVTQPLPKPIEPRIETFGGLRVAGLNKRFSMAERARIPAHWDATIKDVGAPMFGTETFGVCHGFEDDGFTYMVAFPDDGRTDTERLDHIILPAGRYAVFDHVDHISTIDTTWSAIFEAWAPSSGETIGTGPEFERYAIDFNPETPGGVSVWIPLV